MIRDAVARVRAVLPQQVDDFRADRTAREVVVLNLLVAIQECIDLAAHWLADEGWDVAESYREIFLALAEHGVVDPVLAERLASAAGLRNLIVHRYGNVDWARVHQIGSGELDALLEFAAALARRAGTEA